MIAAVKVVIYQPQPDGDYYCSRLFGTISLPTPNIVFEKTGEIGQDVEIVEQAVKEECRRRGITKVANLNL